MRTVALDLSIRSTGMTIYDPENDTYTYHCFLRKDQAKKKVISELGLQGIVYWIHETPVEQITNILQCIHKTERIFAEGLSFGSVGNSGLDLARLHGMLLFGCAANGCNPPEFISPKSIKKYATGNGNASKNDMYNRFIQYNPESKFPNSKPYEDIIDSAWLCQFANNSLF